MKILIDNGHGNNTAGKRSPDNFLLEYKYTREIAAIVTSKLRRRGYDAELLTPEIYDIPLVDRIHRVNVKCNAYGKENVILVSIHCNAAGNGRQWMKARGWEVWTSKGNTASDKFANHMVAAAKSVFTQGEKIRLWSYREDEMDKESNFAILAKTLCPAVLTENFFMDNKEDVAYMLSDHGKKAIVDCHVKGIIDYVDSLEK